MKNAIKAEKVGMKTSEPERFRLVRRIPEQSKNLLWRLLYEVEAASSCV